MMEFQVNQQMQSEEVANIYICMACLQQDLALLARWVSPSSSVSLNIGAEARALDSRGVFSPLQYSTGVFFPLQYGSHALHHKCFSLNVLFAFAHNRNPWHFGWIRNDHSKAQFPLNEWQEMHCGPLLCWSTWPPPLLQDVLLSKDLSVELGG